MEKWRRVSEKKTHKNNRSDGRIILGRRVDVDYEKVWADAVGSAGSTARFSQD